VEALGNCPVCPPLNPALCLSLFVTSWSSTKTAKRNRITQQDLREIRPGSRPTGAPNVGGVGQNRRLLTNNRLYLENSKR